MRFHDLPSAEDDFGIILGNQFDSGGELGKTVLLKVGRVYDDHVIEAVVMPPANVQGRSVVVEHEVFFVHGEARVELIKVNCTRQNC